MYLCVRVCVPVRSQMHRRGFRSPHVKILRMVFGFYLHCSLSEENACEGIWGVGVDNQRARAGLHSYGEEVIGEDV